MLVPGVVTGLDSIYGLVLLLLCRPTQPKQIKRTFCLTLWSSRLVGRQFTGVFSSRRRYTNYLIVVIFEFTRKSCMLTASCRVSLQSGWGT